jgi:hypothetical protein
VGHCFDESRQTVIDVRILRGLPISAIGRKADIWCLLSEVSF